MKKILALIGLLFCFSVSQAWSADLYVDVSAAGDNNGESWANAYTDLQDALSIAADGDTIHVAQGTYTPGDAREASFVLDRDLTLLGGYPTGGGDRDPNAFEQWTNLSGATIEPDHTITKVYHVVTVSGGTVELDGFTITNGFADGVGHSTGGGMYVTGQPDVTLRNTRFLKNQASLGGAGLQFSGASLTLVNVDFGLNRAQAGEGGGLRFTGGSLGMNHVSFNSNQAGDSNGGSGKGGGLYFSGASSLNMDDVNFSRNIAWSDGDQARASGGGIYIDKVIPLIPPPGPYGAPLLGTMTNVSLYANSAMGDYIGMGGGIYVSTTSNTDARWRMEMNNVTLANNQASGNYALGGGICLNISTGSRVVILTNVTFSGNMVNGDNVAQGGGMYAIPQADVLMFNVTFADNIATGGGDTQVGGYYAGRSFNYGLVYSHVENSIFWGNEPDQLYRVSDAQSLIVEGGYTCSYCDDIITEDPMLGTLGNYGGLTETIPLQEGSSAIDAAQYRWTGYMPYTDQRGELRPQGTGYDIGAYEVGVGIRGILIDPSLPVPVNSEIYAEADFTGTLSGTNTYNVSWDWGDGEISIGSVNLDRQTVQGEHAYTQPGVYTIALEVSEVSPDGDLTGILKKAVYQYVVVYDPAAGFVTGGGWIDSLEGAYRDDPALTGKAGFGFVSRYKKGATIPTGNTEFKFETGGLEFHSTSYDWLLVTGSDYAKFKGTGSINGSGVYKFQVWAGDNDPDTFRIKIWSEDDNDDETVIYDNGFDQEINGGSIVIHK